VGEDEEALVAQALHDDLGDVVGAHHLARSRDDASRERLGASGAEALAQQRRVDAHRAQAAHADAAVAVGHREPLGERDRGMLGDRVRRRADLGQQAGGRRRREEVALAALEPSGDEPPGGVHVRAHVDVEGERPRLVGRVEPGAVGDARVGAEQVDRAECVLGARDQVADCAVVAHVALDADGR
jgi:hypothetical protein